MYLDCLLLLSRFVVIIILLSGRERADGRPARVGGADDPYNGNRPLRRRGPLRRVFFSIFTSIFPPPPRTIPGVRHENIHTKKGWSDRVERPSKIVRGERRARILPGASVRVFFNNILCYYFYVRWTNRESVLMK